LITPWVVFAVKFGASELILRDIGLPRLQMGWTHQAWTLSSRSKYPSLSKWR
jgi:hypothetical protein